MWCDSCRQDVPGIASNEADGGFLCARCNNVLNASFQKTEAQTESSATTSVEPSEELPFKFDTWKLQEDLDRVDRLLDSLGRPEPEPIETVKPPFIEAAVSQPMPVMPVHQEKRPVVKPRGSIISWLALSLGCTALAGGLVLIGWSLVVARAELWSIGIPLTILGQAGLLIGLVFQLDGVWQNNRKTQDYLADLEDELQELRHTTKLMNSTSSQSSKSFYMHMAEGASPHLLLSDLKGQIDLLAVQLANENKKR